MVRQEIYRRRLKVWDLVSAFKYGAVVQVNGLTVFLRCSPVSDFAAANVGNMDLSWSTDSQLYGTSELQIFLLP
jgi:hypothetical protein